ncbi:MAG: ATP-binding cassette domain-containing protein, partial [Vulcanimicrobiaceae bacterium]
MNHVPPLLDVVGIHKAFGASEVLRGLSFEMNKGDVWCIIGPSGAGKSTILRCINGLVPIDSGTIRVGAHQVDRLRTDRDLIELR